MRERASLQGCTPVFTCTVTVRLYSVIPERNPTMGLLNTDAFTEHSKIWLVMLLLNARLIFDTREYLYHKNWNILHFHYEVKSDKNTLTLITHKI